MFCCLGRVPSFLLLLPPHRLQVALLQVENERSSGNVAQDKSYHRFCFFLAALAEIIAGKFAVRGSCSHMHKTTVDRSLSKKTIQRKKARLFWETRSNQRHVKHMCFCIFETILGQKTSEELICLAKRKKKPL